MLKLQPSPCNSSHAKCVQSSARESPRAPPLCSLVTFVFMPGEMPITSHMGDWVRDACSCGREDRGAAGVRGQSSEWAGLRPPEPRLAGNQGVPRSRPWCEKVTGGIV